MKFRNSRRGELRSPAGVHRTPLRMGNKILAAALAFVMVFGVLMFVSPTEAQAISLNATDTGFYNLAYGANGATTFGADAQIRVINKTRADKGKSKSDTIYGYDGMTWSAVDTNNYIVWDGTGENTFYGVYPYNAEYNSFTIPTDQSGGVQDADWMTADYTAAKDEGNVNLNFHHCLAKVTVNITKWNSEFDGAEKIIENLKIYTKGTALTATYDDSGVTITATDGETGITPLVSGASYTAIVAPATYASTDKFMTFTACGQEMTVLATTPKQTDGLNAGLHYTFNLTVGKNGVAIQSVEVTDWTDRIINDVESEEAYSNIDAAILTADELNAAVTMALETGETDIEVTLKPDAPAEMITAIRRAICDTEGVADGSIHLTLKGVTTIPGTTNWDGVAFGPGDIYDEAGEIVDQELVTQLASINLPDVTEIGAQAFYFCENLVTVSAPKAQTIGAQALGYTALTSVEFPELTTIPTDMFSGTWTLSSAKFPKVTTIEQGGLLVGAKFTPENNPTPFPLELTAEGDITFNGSYHFNIAERNYTGKVDLVLNIDKKDQVTFHDDGTATWQVREDLNYTFKSITFVD